METKKEILMEKALEKKWLIGLAVTLFSIIFYGTLRSFHTMPVSEGWSTEYAWQINHGNLLYRDFECLFFPLYMLIIAGVTRIFGYSIIVLRILGIYLAAAIGGSLYCLFTKLFNAFSSALASVLGVLCITSTSASILYGYLRLHDLFLILGTTLLVYFSCRAFYGAGAAMGERSVAISKGLQIAAPVILAFDGVVGLIQNISGHPFRTLVFLLLLLLAVIWLAIPALLGKKNGRKYLVTALPMQAVMCGVCISAECMIRQSTGAMMIAFIMAYFLFCAVALKSREFWRGLVGALTGVFFSFGLLLVYLLVTNSFDGFVDQCFHSAIAAKGGILTELFRWIPNDWAKFWTYRDAAFLVVLLIDLLIGWRVYRMGMKTEGWAASVPALVVCGGVLTVICWGFMRNQPLADMASKQYNAATTAVAEISFFICTIAFFCYGFYMLICFLQRRKLSDEAAKYFLFFPVLGVAFTQGWGCGTSAGLNCTQTFIAFGLLLAFCLHTALSAKRTVLAAGILGCSLFLGAIFVGQKAVYTYSWWSLMQGSVWEHTEKVDVPLLEGLRVRPTDKEFYETVYADVTKNTEEDDPIFVFPHCPILYTITGRHSTTFSKVQWFDVSSASAIRSDIETLRADPPRMVVYLSLPESVYESHENSFATYQTREMRDFLLEELLITNQYESLHNIDLGNGYTANIFLLAG